MEDIHELERDEAAEPVAGGGLTRREFLAGAGGMGVTAILGGFFVRAFLLPDKALAIPVSGGYLIIDQTKCSGCTSCMMACSLTHHGKTSQSLSRIQVNQDSFGKFPEDIHISQCRQCPFPSCVEACPTGAMHADAQTGVRTVDIAKCIGCERCVNACPFTPSRALWNFEEKHAQKCDLCVDAPFWNEKGGPEGKRACESVCPMRAISFTKDLPVQGDEGYYVDLHTGTPWDPRFYGAVGASGVPGSGTTAKK